MRQRGSQYWAWANSQPAMKQHEEVISDGTQIDVQVRTGRGGVTQMFLGVYDAAGNLLFEEFQASLKDKTMMYALALGVDRARDMATGFLVHRRPAALHSSIAY